jgi:predicted phosphodiesterase
MLIGFISDIHEDLLSLENALRILNKKNCDTIICLGDIVGFALPFYKYIKKRNADECIKLVRENCILSVIGNHDLFAIRKVPHYNAGFKYGSNWYDLDYEDRARRAKNKIWIYEDNEIIASLNSASIEYLSSLKEIEIFKTEYDRLLLSHFCAPDYSGSAIFFPGNIFHMKQHYEFMKIENCQISFSGHGHPEGCLAADDEKITLVKYNKKLLLNNYKWIVVPCVARTTRSNGVLIFDTAKKEIDIIPLNSTL